MGSVYFLPQSKWRIVLAEDKNKDKLQSLLDYIQRINNSSAQECQIMFKEIIRKKYKRILELGISKGHSTIPLLIAAYLNKGKLISNDIKVIHKLDEWLIKFNCEFLAKYWTFYIGNDLKLRRSYKFLSKKFDMIFLDTSHASYHTIAELDKFSKWSDIIYCHDYNSNGVKIPVNDFASNNKDWHLENYHTNCGFVKLFKS